ncbi:MAG TPA: SET domain-containing protein-lysine N-methyltransferase [Gaiellaceae bacterium]|nr:SET domain-containing protein-lysine N-methyltransferase [Gaiellaceae bacterium]
MIHPETELRIVGESIGHGVVAKAFIPKGTVVWVRDDFDLLFTEAEIDRLPPCYRIITDKYAYLDADGMHVLCWDFARYVNHSCEPSCLGGTSEFEVAVRDLQPGDELTNDYATLNLKTTERFQCHCGAPHCRGTVRPEDAVTLSARWTQTFQATLALAPTVPQPLSPFFPEHGMPELEALKNGHRAP